jgi:hypothetical protein
MSIIYEPEDDFDIVKSTMICIGSPATETIIQYLDKDYSLVHVLAGIGDEASIDALLRYARQSPSNIHLVREAWSYAASLNEAMHQNYGKPENPFGQRMLNGYIEMLYDESFEFWEDAAKHIFGEITDQHSEEILFFIPATRKERFVQLHENFWEERRKWAKPKAPN